MRGILLVHVPEPSHLDTPFHSAAEMVSAEAIKVRTAVCVCICLNYSSISQIEYLILQYI